VRAAHNTIAGSPKVTADNFDRVWDVLTNYLRDDMDHSGELEANPDALAKLKDINPS